LFTFGFAADAFGDGAAAASPLATPLAANAKLTNIAEARRVMS
jgi:hypothetical protein